MRRQRGEPSSSAYSLQISGAKQKDAFWKTERERERERKGQTLHAASPPPSVVSTAAINHMYAQHPQLREKKTGFLCQKVPPDVRDPEPRSETWGEKRKDSVTVHKSGEKALLKPRNHTLIPLVPSRYIIT